MIKITSKGEQDCWGIGINYNPDFRDISFHFLKWYIAIGFGEEMIPWEEVQARLASAAEIEWSEEDQWYWLADINGCEVCEDVIYEGDPYMLLDDDDGESIIVCEYCLNPDLKDE